MRVLFTGVCGVLLLLPAAARGTPFAAPSAPAAASSNLGLDVRFAIHWGNAECPSGSPTTTSCYTGVGRTVVRGLGQTQLDLFDVVDRSDPALRCEKWSFTGSLDAGAKGFIALAGSSDGCIAWHSALG